MKGNVRMTPKRILLSLGNGVAAGLLAVAITYVIISIHHLPYQLVWLIYVVVAIGLSILVSKKPAWFLGAVIFLLVLMGFLLMFLSAKEELCKQITWNPSMLGAGASIVALGITYLTLFYQRPPKETATELRATAPELDKKVAELNKKLNKLENVIDTFLEESQKLAQKINQITRGDDRKDN